ncbi:MAG: LuxR C-terminal-related transcriptional regulator [Clostridia bacterium]|nr:LuxR C-terminal-related transcriptional regulator [Clostridia bacterium]
MNRPFYKALSKVIVLMLMLATLLIPLSAAAEGAPLITTVGELTAALATASDGDTLLVGDITFKPMPMGMIIVPKNVTLKSGKGTNAVFTNATFALNGTASDSAPLTVNFENIDFRGDNTGNVIDPSAPPNIGAKMPDIMKTMCAAIFKMNVDATYTGCTFEGYHYAYGGVFNAIYSSADNRNTLNLTLNGCVFQNNAAKYGGSIYLSGYGHNVTLDARHCIFDNNAATTGGAVWAQDADVHLLDCSLVGNQYLEAAVTEPNGGALALYTCGVDLDGCLIASNTSGGGGAGVFCEISPFRTLIMENCTVIGNTAASDEGVSVVLAKTNFDTTAAAHVYFSSLFGEQNLADNVELFGCLIVKKGVEEQEPSEENGYCLEITPETAQEMGIVPEKPQHVTLPADEYAIPKEAVDKVAGGKFSNSLGRLQVGDNYTEKVAVTVEEKPGRQKSVLLQYGDKLTLKIPERKGFAFTGWNFPKGTPIESDQTYIGGKLPDAPVMARWHFVLSENLYIIWVPLLLLAVFGAFILYRRRSKQPAVVIPPAEAAPVTQEPLLPADWIDRVCEKPEIAALVSKRETEVLHKLLEGKSRKQIAEELFITEATIRKHSTSIYAKFCVHNRAELVYKLTKQ